jgi:hypothetical protein
VKSYTRLGVTAATAALATAAATVALPAQAQAAADGANQGLNAAQTLATARVDGRLATLHALRLAVTDAEHLTGADRSALDSLIDADLSGLTALHDKIPTETTVAAVRADDTAMLDDYRVYLLVAPKVRLTTAFDVEDSAEATLQQAHDALAAKLAAAPGGGTAAEQAELADLRAQIQAARTASTGQVATLLAIQPGADAAAIRAELEPLVTAAKTARKDLVQARADAQQLRAALK